VVEHLCSKHKAPSSNPNTTTKRKKEGRKERKKERKKEGRGDSKMAARGRKQKACLLK
jgi:hypothetical protein